MSEQTWVHKGEDIIVDRDGVFHCEELKLEATSLDALKKKINDAPAKDTKLGPLKVFYNYYGGATGLQEVTITRMAEEGWRGRAEVWAVIQNQKGEKSRRKVEVAHLRPFNPTARDKMMAQEFLHREKMTALEAKQAEERKKLLDELDFHPFTKDTLLAACADAAGDNEGE